MKTPRLLFQAIPLALVLCVVTSLSHAEDWTRFRGPNGTGISSESGFPTAWTREDLEWKTQLPGTGHSSPVTWENSVYVTAADESAQKLSLLAINASDGTIKWKRDYPYAPLRLHPSNSHATSSPVVNENGIYFIVFGSGQCDVVALDFDGNERWRRDFGRSITQHGPGTSPIIYDNKLIFPYENLENNEGLLGQWYALDCDSGETLWKLVRENSSKTSCAAPCVYTAKNGQDWIIFSSFAHGLTAVDPDNGKVVWEIQTDRPARVVSSPVLAGDLIITTNGGGSRYELLTAVLPDDSGASSPKTVYTQDQKHVPYVPTSIAVNDLLFHFQDDGYISCAEIATGKILWSERHRGGFSGSPVLAGDHLYCINSRGQVVVIEASETYNHIATNDLGERSQATPAIANGKMFLRTESTLSCLAVQ